MLAESDALLDEVRDHLLSEVERAEALGAPVGPALDAAIARVGDPATVGSGWRVELVRGAVARARAGVCAAAVGWLDRWALTATGLAVLAAVLAGGDLADLLTTRSSSAPGSVTARGVLVGTAVSLVAVAVTVPGLHRLRRVVLPLGGPGRPRRS